jgi:anaerobic ribonucleoside-triphosphate reductase
MEININNKIAGGDQMEIVKRDNSKVEFNEKKIEAAILKAMNDVNEVDIHLANKISVDIKSRILELENDVDIEYIQNQVENELLMYGEFKVAKAYIKYRGIQEHKRSMKRRSNTNRILTQQTRENANKNSDLISTKKGLTLDSYIQEEMLEYDLPKRLALAHKRNEIKFHDVADRKFGSINCCLFDMKKVIENNPNINGLQYDTSESIEAYLGVLSDVLLEASSMQYGGFSINEIDYVLEDALENAYQKSIKYYTSELRDNISEEKIKDLALNFVERAFRKRWNGIETRLNSISNSNTQVPFETISLGNRTSFWSRFVTRIILETRLKGCGKYKQTAIFPKIVFFYREEIHGVGGVNEDLYNLAIECRSKRAYPDFLSLDNGYCGYIWKTYGFALAPMGK